jgi:hypothetical protein
VDVFVAFGDLLSLFPPNTLYDTGQLQPNAKLLCST